MNPNTRESTTYRLERNPEDSRVKHNMTLQIDQYKNSLETLKIAYGRILGQTELLVQD